ncbi:hypothetical protein KI387_032502, partial [Taxus chinensis]
EDTLVHEIEESDVEECDAHHEEISFKESKVEGHEEPITHILKEKQACTKKHDFERSIGHEVERIIENIVEHKVECEKEEENNI